MDDTISRQDAIDAVEHITSSMSVCVNSDECHGMKRMQRQAVIKLANLPSAQPEIIRCKDCKYCEHWYADKGRCFLWHEDGIDVFGDGFCNYAERRTNE